MRDHETMMTLIREVASKREDVRAVVMNGSRVTDPCKDAYQDYDIVYFVTDFESFIESRAWIDVFGERLMMHTSDDMVFHPASMENGTMFQMLFKDKNRIDLLIKPVEVFDQHIQENRNYEVLVDKDSLSKDIPSPSREQFSIQKPTERVFTSCVKELLWVAPYIAKGLCRGEMLYALNHLSHIRENVLALLKWRAGVENGFDTILKKAADDFDEYLDVSMVKRYYTTYTDANPASIWHALFMILDLAEENAWFLSNKLGYPDVLGPLFGLRKYLKTLKEEC